MRPPCLGGVFFINNEGGVTMLEVTAMAVEKLKEYLQQNNISSAVRVALMQGG